VINKKKQLLKTKSFCSLCFRGWQLSFQT